VEIAVVRSLRLRRAGVAGSVLLLASSVGWWVAQHPQDPEIPQLAPILLAWFAALAVVGCFLPGVANQISVTRAYLAGPALAYALDPHGLGGLAIVVAVAGATDLVDGAVARRLECPTRLGGALDPVVDGVFFGAAAIGLALGDAYPWWLGLVVVLRYAVPAAVGAVMVLLARPVELRHTPLGQASTTVIAIALGGIALLRGLGLPYAWLEIAAAVAVPVFTLATWGNLFWVSRRAFSRRPSG
jgi:phosphatidylglycerophosphate synthase